MLITLPAIDFTLFKALNDFAAARDGLVEDSLRFCALNLQYAFVALLAALFLVRGEGRSVNARHGVWPPASARYSPSAWRTSSPTPGPGRAPTTPIPARTSS